MSVEAAASVMCNLVKGDFFVGRNGTIELETLLFYTKNRPHGGTYPKHMLDRIERHAGVWPATTESIDAWAKEYVNGLPLLDAAAAGWFKPLAHEELEMMAKLAPEATLMPLRALEPYYVEPRLRWSAALAGKKVAVVTSFAATAQGQIGKRLWDFQESLLPSTTEWSFIRSGYCPSVAGSSPCGWPEGINSWQGAVEYLVDAVRFTGASVALIGCGGIGMLVAARLRRIGVSAIVMGGAVQVLFGIRGRRWQTHPVIGDFWTTDWAAPSEEETPDAARLIEGGCYWA